MAVKKNKNPYLKPIIIAVVVIIVLVFLMMITKSRNTNGPMTQEEITKLNAQLKEEKAKEIKQDLSAKSEQERMQYYCGSFFQLIDSQKYQEAYDLLYDEYKENFFPTFENFQRYIKEFFPADFALSYLNIERLGDIYVLNVTLRDLVNGSLGHNFDMFVVLRENALNDYDISFSRNSAVEEEDE